MKWFTKKQQVSVTFIQLVLLCVIYENKTKHFPVDGRYHPSTLSFTCITYDESSPLSRFRGSERDYLLDCSPDIRSPTGGVTINLSCSLTTRPCVIYWNSTSDKLLWQYYPIILVSTLYILVLLLLSLHVLAQIADV